MTTQDVGMYDFRQYVPPHQSSERRVDPRLRTACGIPASVGAAELLARKDRAHFIHPFTDHRRLQREGLNVFTHGDGIYLTDIHGKCWIDGMSGLWCVTLGYSNPELIAAASRQLQTLPYCSSFFQSTHPGAIELANAISEVTPDSLDHVFFSNSGSEANDTAARIVRRYWELRGAPERRVIISRRNAYHGSTLAGASLGGFACMHAQGGLPIADITHVRQPYWYGEGRDESEAQFGLTAARSLETEILRLGADRVAAFIAEPIQAAGGVIIPPSTYWPAIERIARRYGVLIIADEVVCGFGRTGAWFGCQQQGFAPDIMTMSKGLSSGYAPIAATVVSNSIAATLLGEEGEFEHGFTCSAHPVSCAVALKVIEILRRERLVEAVRVDLAPYFYSHLAQFAACSAVADVRAVGLMAAIELVAPAETPASLSGVLGAKFRSLCGEVGLIVRAEGNTIMIAPPLICTRSDIDRIAERLESAFGSLTRILRAQRTA